MTCPHSASNLPASCCWQHFEQAKSTSLGLVPGVEVTLSGFPFNAVFNACALAFPRCQTPGHCGPCVCPSSPAPSYGGCSFEPWAGELAPASTAQGTHALLLCPLHRLATNSTASFHVKRPRVGGRGPYAASAPLLCLLSGQACRLLCPVLPSHGPWRWCAAAACLGSSRGRGCVPARWILPLL